MLPRRPEGLRRNMQLHNPSDTQKNALRRCTSPIPAPVFIMLVFTGGTKDSFFFFKIYVSTLLACTNLCRRPVQQWGCGDTELCFKVEKGAGVAGRKKIKNPSNVLMVATQDEVYMA